MAPRRLALYVGHVLAASAWLSGCGARTDPFAEMRVDAGAIVGASDAEQDADVSTCGSSGYCTTTTAAFAATFGGLIQGDAICGAEYPGAHFYRKSCDQERPFFPALAKWPAGYGEVEALGCWNCEGWISASGPYDSSIAIPGCTLGYATVAALVPSPESGPPLWRICEAGDWPLACCVPQ
jgi:hypothetical protein